MTFETPEFDLEPWHEAPEEFWSLAPEQHDAVLRLVRLLVRGPIDCVAVIPYRSQEGDRHGDVELLPNGDRLIRVGWSTAPGSYRAISIKIGG